MPTLAPQLNFTFFQNARDYVTITFGLMLYAIGFTCFMLPYEITTGGLAGACAVIFYATGFPVQYTFFIVNILLLIAAVRVLGWKFCIKTIYAVLMLTVLLGAMQQVLRGMGQVHPEYFSGFSTQGLPRVADDMFMSTLIGAAIEGVGIGIVFLSNGSTGGTDIIAAIINKYKDVTLGQMAMLCDITIVTSSLLLPTSTVRVVLYGYCTLIVTNLLLDYVVDRGRQSVQFFIFSQKYDEIAAAINGIHRGVTVLTGQGWYTKQERKVIVVIAKKNESPLIFRIIQNIDPRAFVSQSKVIGVFGYGFDRIKVKADKDIEQKTAAVARKVAADQAASVQNGAAPSEN